MRRFTTKTIAFLTCLGLLAGVSRAGQPSDRFTLGRYIPGDVWIYSHSVKNPQNAWLDDEWREVFDALKASGIDRDISSLILSALSGEDRVQAESAVEKWTALIKQIPWEDLFAREFAFAERMRMGLSDIDYFVMTRVAEGRAAECAAALVEILKELATLYDTLEVTERKLNGATVWSVSLKAHEDVPFKSIELLVKGDDIALTTSPKAVGEIAALIDGKNTKPPIVATPRFKKAIAEVKPPEDSFSFFDMKMLVASLQGLCDHGQDRPQTNGKQYPGKGKIGIFKAVVSLLDVIDYAVVSVDTANRRQFTHTFVRLQQGKQKCALACCCLDRKPFKRFDEFIPADATGFSLNGFINLEEFYKLVTDFIKKELPDGTERMAEWNGLLATVGFDPQRDLFSWFSGEMINVTLPPDIVKPMGGNDWVSMYRVKDSELATRKVTAAIDFVSAKLQSQGQMLMIAPASVNAPGFRRITHPMLMMFLQPVIGVKGDWLMIGSSAAAINRCLDVAAGKAPSIVKNERFRKEGLTPSGPVLSASFKDTSNFGKELGTVFGMAGMVGGLISASIEGEGEGAGQTKSIVQKVAGIVMKLGPVIQKIDFYSSESSITTYDGATGVRIERVVTYKPPKETKVKTARAVPD